MTQHEKLDRLRAMRLWPLLIMMEDECDTRLQWENISVADVIDRMLDELPDWMFKYPPK